MKKKKLFIGLVLFALTITAVFAYQYLTPSDKKIFIDDIKHNIYSDVSVLTVDQVDSTINYYRKYFNFNLYKKFPFEGKATHAVMELNKYFVMFCDKNIFEEEKKQLSGGYISSSFSLYIDVDDINIIYNRIKKDLEVVQPLDIMFYERKEFSVRDLNGYIVTFSQSMDPGDK